MQLIGVRVSARGAGEILLTSMDKDGTKEGFDNEILCEISNKLSIPVIASGGAVVCNIYMMQYR